MNSASDSTDARKPRLRSFKWIAALLALSIAALFLYPVLFGTRFDSAGWRAQQGYDAIRREMVDDLLGRHQLVGMSRAEIDTLLGIPPDTEYFASYDYVYWLGPERGFISIDSEWLCLKFSDDDIVVDARVTQD